jgi:hypothetical protein
MNNKKKNAIRFDIDCSNIKKMKLVQLFTIFLVSSIFHTSAAESDLMVKGNGALTLDGEKRK